MAERMRSRLRIFSPRVSNSQRNSRRKAGSPMIRRSWSRNSGEMRGQVGGGDFEAGPGDFLVVPLGVEEAGVGAGGGDEPEGAVGGGEGAGEDFEHGVGDDGSLLEDEEVGGVAAVVADDAGETDEAGAVRE
jgi:hypothetical protein